jgi:hypothetical protein
MNRHISALDRNLARSGEPVLLRRINPSPALPSDVTIKGVIRGYRPEELVGGITMTDVQVIFSPTEMSAANWPQPPRVNDKLIAAGKTRNIAVVSAIKIGDEIVRYEARATG